MAGHGKMWETNPLSAFPENRVIWNTVMQQTDACLKTQAEILARLQSASDRWLRHRRENLEDASTAIKRMCECEDIGEAANIQQKWLSDCLQSMMDDWTAISATTATVATRDVVAGARAAAPEAKAARKVAA